MRPARWSPLVGLGWRVSLNGSIGLIDSLAGVVEIGLRRRRLFRLAVLPWPARGLFVSLQDPEAFLHALTSLPSPS